MTWRVAPSHRPELYDRFAQGERRILTAMEPGNVLVPAGHLLVAAGQPQRRAYRVRTGWACRTVALADGRRQIVSILLPGDMIGIKGLVVARPTESVEALTPVTLNWCPRERLLELGETHPEVMLRLLLTAAETDRRLERWMLALARCSAEERLAAFLLSLRARLRAIGLMPRDTFLLPMTQQQIGDHLGLTVVHVNRVMRRLREAGLLMQQKRAITLLNVPALQRLAAPMTGVVAQAAEAAETAAQ
jgi:CRP/FNR family transcriptional regulator